jgi:hypothetical protein
MKKPVKKGDIVDYIVVHESFIGDLQREVMKYVELGYKPMGGISTACTVGSTTLFSQAMVYRAAFDHEDESMD